MPHTSRVQIVVTLGPATKEMSVVRQLVEHQIDVVRLNFAWGTHDEHAHYIATIRAVAREFGRHIPTIQDLAGPRIQKKDGHEFNAAATDIITAKDLQDLGFGLSHNVEYICMSYVGNAADINRLRENIAERGGTAKVIAKVERQEALDNINAIIRVSDAIMIGRGDLGQNIPIERVPFAEATIIKKCKSAKKPVITATQMLLSMVENPEPTRAEVTDIAYAILLGSDAVMLSEETARGKYPVQAVTIMKRVVLEAERHEHKIEVNPL